MLTLDALMDRFKEDQMHPRFSRRLRRWLKAQNGRVGIGGGWRPVGTQPVRPGFAPEGRSFHQTQHFASGPWFCAVDLVVAQPGGRHRAPRWDEVPRQGTPEAHKWGVHCNVETEPWHMQPVEIDGWVSWVNAGRPEPRRYRRRLK